MMQNVPTGGVGIFAGTSFKEGQTVESTLAIPVTIEACSINTHLSHRAILLRYVFGLNETWDALALGYSMVYSHSENPSIRNFWQSRVDSDSLYLAWRAERDIPAGQEIYDTYGGPKWFQENGIPYEPIAEPQYAKSGVYEYPCISSKVVVAPDDTVVAARRIAQGEIIEISRVLIIAEATASRGTPLSKYAWKWLDPVVEDNQVPLAAVLLGNGALYQAAPESTQHVNAIFEWFDDTTLPVDHRKCHETLMIKFTASRDIMYGERIYIYLRVSPESNERFVPPGFQYPCSDPQAAQEDREL